MTEQPRTHGLDDAERTDLADPGAQSQPAEGGRDTVADLPGADTGTAADESAGEDHQDRP